MRHVDVSFDADTHSADAIQRAGYRFCDRFSLELVRDGSRYVCGLVFADETTAIDQAVADFRVEVLDQVLRERIRSETEATRNLILALAFSKTDLASE